MNWERNITTFACIPYSTRFSFNSCFLQFKRSKISSFSLGKQSVYVFVYVLPSHVSWFDSYLDTKTPKAFYLQFPFILLCIFPPYHSALSPIVCCDGKDFQLILPINSCGSSGSPV